MGLKPKVAIYDFTDCEGCEVQLVSLRKKFIELEKQIDIVDWRLGQEKRFKPLFDITIIEGTPITKDEIDTLRYLRKNSKIIIALGACASIAGIPGIMKKSQRLRWYKKIYPSASSGQAYKPKGIDAQPLQRYVKVDFMIQGCPVDQNEVVKIVSDLLVGKKPKSRPYSVCFECKLAENKCRIAEEHKPCLGPVTQGGCGAVCVSGGSPCYGCFGVREGANVEGLKKILGEKEFKRYYSMFLNKRRNNSN